MQLQLLHGSKVEEIFKVGEESTIDDALDDSLQM